MNLEKIKKSIDSAGVVEELIMLSNKIFGKNTDDVKNVIEMFITTSYLMGKKNAVKSFDD
jgi:hypothetical protein